MLNVSELSPIAWVFLRLLLVMEKKKLDVSTVFCSFPGVDRCVYVFKDTRARMCTCVKARKTEADQILVDMDFQPQVQIEGCFYIVPNKRSRESEALVMLTAEL